MAKRKRYLHPMIRCLWGSAQQATKGVGEKFSADFDQSKVKLFNSEPERNRKTAGITAYHGGSKLKTPTAKT
jgi:hypothetical protein